MSGGGQSSLEYLIIVVAVLAVSAFIVMFVGGSFGVQKEPAAISICKEAAAQCKSLRTIDPTIDCPACVAQCSDKSTGKDVVDRQTANAPGGPYGTAAMCCRLGLPDEIYSGRTTQCTAAPKTDASLTSISLTTPNPTPGQQVLAITAPAFDVGTTTIAKMTISFSGTFFGAAPPQPVTCKTGVLTPRSCYGAVYYVNAPGTAGLYDVKAEVTALFAADGSALTDANPGNNKFTITVPVGVASKKNYDLAVQIDLAKTNALANEKVAYTGTVTNVGSQPVTPTASLTVPQAAVQKEQTSTTCSGQLASGASCQVKGNVWSASAGSYSITFSATSSPADEDNSNNQASLVFTVNEAPKPNLYVKSLTITPNTGTPGTPITITSVVHLEGSISSTYAYQVTMNPKNDASQKTIITGGQVPSGSHAADSDYTITRSGTAITIPTGYPPGAYTATITVDSAGAIAESKEDDNSLSTDVTVQQQDVVDAEAVSIALGWQPDGSNPAYLPALTDVFGGRTVKVYALYWTNNPDGSTTKHGGIKNAGTKAGTITYKIYDSFSGADTEIKSGTCGLVAGGGECSVEPFDWVVPADKIGAHQVKLKVAASGDANPGNDAKTHDFNANSRTGSSAASVNDLTAVYEDDYVNRDFYGRDVVRVEKNRVSVASGDVYFPSGRIDVDANGAISVATLDRVDSPPGTRDLAFVAYYNSYTKSYEYILRYTAPSGGYYDLGAGTIDTESAGGRWERVRAVSFSSTESGRLDSVAVFYVVRSTGGSPGFDYKFRIYSVIKAPSNLDTVVLSDFGTVVSISPGSDGSTSGGEKYTGNEIALDVTPLSSESNAKQDLLLFVYSNDNSDAYSARLFSTTASAFRNIYEARNPQGNPAADPTIDTVYKVNTDLTESTEISAATANSDGLNWMNNLAYVAFSDAGNKNYKFVRYNTATCKWYTNAQGQEVHPCGDNINYNTVTQATFTRGSPGHIDDVPSTGSWTGIKAVAHDSTSYTTNPDGSVTVTGHGVMDRVAFAYTKNVDAAYRYKVINHDGIAVAGPANLAFHSAGTSNQDLAFLDGTAFSVEPGYLNGIAFSLYGDPDLSSGQAYYIRGIRGAYGTFSQQLGGYPFGADQKTRRTAIAAGTATNWNPIFR